MYLRTLLTCVSIGAIVLLGCDPDRLGTDIEPVEVPVGVAVVVENLAIAGVTVEVTGPGMVHPIVANLPIADGVASGNVVVLAGSDRIFTLRAFDAQGLETHNGEDTVDIPGNEATSLTVALTPLVGDVDLDGHVGDFTITISPASTTLTVGETVQLVAVVTDAQDATVAGATVTWGSSNPARASVSADGLVEGLVPGDVTIGASYKGFAGVATVTVQ